MKASEARQAFNMLLESIGSVSDYEKYDQAAQALSSFIQEQEETPEIYVFRVRNTLTGLYRDGGNQGWSKRGKTWKQANHLKTHFTQAYDADVQNNIPRYWDKENRPAVHAYVASLIPETYMVELIPLTKKGEITEINARDFYLNYGKHTRR